MKIIKAIKSINYTDVFMRALWTFLQAFLATAIIGLEPIIDTLFTGDWGGVYVLSVALFVGSLSAGLSAVKTIVLETVRELKTKIQ